MKLTTVSLLEELRRPSTIGLLLLTALYGAFECRIFLPPALSEGLFYGTVVTSGACVLYAATKRSWLALGFAAGVAGAVLTIPFRGVGLSICVCLVLASFAYAMHRGSSKAWLLAARATAILVVAALGFGSSCYLYHASIRAGIARGQALVDAIGRYQASVGVPDSLQALVPEWIEEIPNPGRNADPEFTYISRGHVLPVELERPESFRIFARYYGWQTWWAQVLGSFGTREEVIDYVAEESHIYDDSIGRTVYRHGRWTHSVGTRAFRPTF